MCPLLRFKDFQFFLFLLLEKMDKLIYNFESLSLNQPKEEIISWTEENFPRCRNADYLIDYLKSRPDTVVLDKFYQRSGTIVYFCMKVYDNDKGGDPVILQVPLEAKKGQKMTSSKVNRGYVYY